MRFSLQNMIWILVLLALVLAAVFAFNPKPISVEVATATVGPLRVSVQEDGKTRIREKYTVSAPVAGRLSRIELESGDRVSADGTLLAVILPTEPAMLDARSKAQAKARVQMAEATVKRSKSNAIQAEINFNLSQSKFDRAKRLRTDQAISQNEYDVVKAEFLTSQQALRTSKFDSEIASFELEMSEAALLQFNGGDSQGQVQPFQLTSPIFGKVLRVFQESSTVVSMGTPLMELGDPTQLEIEIDVLSIDAVRIQPGAELTIEHWGGETPLTGSVRVIEPAAFTKISSLGVEEQRVNIIADFNETIERVSTLGDGYRVEARITIEQLDDALLIPNSALFRHQREWHVFIITAEDTALMRPVTIGSQNETHTQIVDGLTSGDHVIVYPSDELTTGTKIEVAE